VGAGARPLWNVSRKREVVVAKQVDSNTSFDEAVEVLSKGVQNEEAWDQLEEAGQAAGRVEDVLAQYQRVLASSPEPQVALMVAERAVYFLDEWGDDKELQLRLLRRILELDSTVQWAFDRASLYLTTAGRWDELLDLYDRVIAATNDVRRKAALLEEVAHVAKDSAGNPERAIDYLKQVFELQPTDKLTASALERLLKQKERYRELISFWNQRLKVISGDEALETYHQIAACWLENLNDPAGALAAIESLLADESTSEAACQLLEKTLASPASNREARRRALQHLSKRYDGTDRWVDVVKPLEAALKFVDRDERAGMHIEIARRLVEHGQLEEAVRHLAALVVIDSGNWDRELLQAVLSGGFDRAVAGLKLKLDKEQGRRLLRRAAEMAAGELDEPDRAIELYSRLLRDQPDDVEAIERLAVLYQRAERPQDLLRLRRHEFTLADTVEKRLELRL
jgi:tetratricopeptide (TPR) repeat protein